MNGHLLVRFIRKLPYMTVDKIPHILRFIILFQKKKSSKFLLSLNFIFTLLLPIKRSDIPGSDDGKKL